MSPELTYFLKTNIAIALCYTFYRLFFYRDTFFEWRRLAFICFFMISALYPILNIEEWVKGSKPMVAMADLYATIMLPEVAIGEQAQIGFNWQHLLSSACFYIYVGIFLVLLIRFLAQLFSILRLHRHCAKTFIKGNPIYLLDKPIGPFSFFRWIFIYRGSHKDSELEEILAHEQAHVHQWHSMDVIFSELACIICWFNPFAWLLKHEIRCNLEYLADKTVLESGHDSKAYQYHLLELTSHTKAAATLYNSFNVLPLKNRIKMMNRKRTKDVGKSKYLLFLPLAALLMIISNIESVARTAKSFANKVLPEQSISTAENTSLIKESVDHANSGSTSSVLQRQAIISAKDSLDKEPLFQVVEHMPDFPGGQQALIRFIAQNLKYPASAKEQKTEGRVIAQFVVEKDGKVSHPHIVRSISPALDAEALRVIAMMPAWEPGKQRGKNVRVKYTVPISFNLDKKDKPQEVKKNDLPEIVTVAYTPHTTEAEQPVFRVVEKMPEYPGGMEGLMHFLASNIKYPLEAQKAKIEGRVIVQMIIDEKGNITSPSIMTSVSPSLDAEAIRVVGSMQKWIPGNQKGKAVKVKYTLPITFKLNPPAKVTKK